MILIRLNAPALTLEEQEEVAEQIRQTVGMEIAFGPDREIIEGNITVEVEVI